MYDDRYRDEDGFYVLVRKQQETECSKREIEHATNDRRLKAMVPYNPGELSFLRDGGLGNDTPKLYDIVDKVDSWSSAAWRAYINKPLNEPSVKYFMMAKNWKVSRMTRIVINYKYRIDGNVMYQFPNEKGRDRYQLIESLIELERALTFMTLGTLNISREYNAKSGSYYAKSSVKAVIAFVDKRSLTFQGTLEDFLVYLGVPITKELVSRKPIKLPRKNSITFRRSNNGR